MTDEPVARRVVVHGHVQGVFFRESTRRAAQQRGVTGWVHNLPNGTVEAWLEGKPDAVQSLITFCGQGPRGARVDNVEVHEAAPRHSTAFEIR